MLLPIRQLDQKSVFFDLPGSIGEIQDFANDGRIAPDEWVIGKLAHSSAFQVMLVAATIPCRKRPRLFGSAFRTTCRGAANWRAGWYPHHVIGRSWLWFTVTPESGFARVFIKQIFLAESTTSIGDFGVPDFQPDTLSEFPTISASDFGASLDGGLASLTSDPRMIRYNLEKSCACKRVQLSAVTGIVEPLEFFTFQEETRFATNSQASSSALTAHSGSIFFVAHGNANL